MNSTDESTEGVWVVGSNKSIDETYSLADTVTAEINCARSGIQNEDTSDTVTAKFYDGNRLITEEVMTKTSWCKYNAEFTIDSADQQVTKVIIETDGENALFIDYFELQGSNTYQWGKNGGDGWCLSQDAGDSSGDWNRYVNGSCEDAFDFYFGYQNAY